MTSTSTVPGVPAGTVAEIMESLTTVKLRAGRKPKSTLVVPEKPEPLMVTTLPPAVMPLVGDTEVTIGKPTKFWQLRIQQKSKKKGTLNLSANVFCAHLTIDLHLKKLKYADIY